MSARPSHDRNEGEEIGAVPVRRVAVYPLDFQDATGDTSITPQQQQYLKKNIKIDPERQQLCQQHFYTGEVICGENDGRSVLPHGKGMLLWVLYATALESSDAAPGPSVGLPYDLLVREFGEVSTLRGAVLLSLSVYSGTFRRGKRYGTGELAVYPKNLRVGCGWEDNKPVLDRAQCVMYCSSAAQSAATHDSTAANAGSPNAKKSISFGSLLSSAMSNTGKATSALTADQHYLGTLSMTIQGVKWQSFRLDGLAWSQYANFTPDGVGEMWYAGGTRYCGQWMSGQQHGFGVEFEQNNHNCAVYVGSFNQHQRCGAGTLHNCRTGVVVSGTWNAGSLANAADVVLPSWPFTMHGAQWKNISDWTFDKASLALSDTSLNGTWEPLFTTLDEVLTTSLGGDHEDTGVPERESQCEEETVVDDETEGGEWGQASMELLKSFMQLAELKAALMLFQRCFYFLYKPCVSGCRAVDGEMRPSAEKGKPRKDDTDLSPGPTGGSSEMITKLRKLGQKDQRTAMLGECGRYWNSPSWCQEMRLMSGGTLHEENAGCTSTYSCIHTTHVAEALAKRLPPEALFKWAVRDLAALVSSVRLRLLSRIASHPAVSTAAGSRRVLAGCWDAVYSLVAPVMHDLATAVELKASSATSVALQRCINLSPNDFVTASSASSPLSDEEKVIMQCGGAVASPFLHWHRCTEQTSNGPLIQFGSYGNRGKAFNREMVTVYATPSNLLAVFATLHRRADYLFPRSALQRERWLSCCIAATFTRMAGVHPYMALSPPAVLRVLAALAADVNPGYPFSIGDSFGVDGKLEECSFANADSNRNNNSELTQVMALLLASYDSVERLQYTYPTIRYVPPPTDTETGNPSNVVYPLDEFAVRARFVLLGAATDAVQCGHPWLECLSNRCAQTGAINIGNVCHCGLGEDIAPRVVTNDTSPSGGVALMRQGIECALRLPVCVMQDKLNEWQAQLDVCGTEHHRTTEGGTSHDTKKAQIPFLSSEVLSWVMKCVESVLELPNLYGMGKPAAASRMTSVQRSFESSVQSPRDTDGMGHRITAMAVVDECLNETTRSGASSSNNGTPALSYHWKLFLPHSRPFAVGTADIHRSTVAVDLFDTQSSGAQPEGLITAAEVIHFTLMHRLLADVGIGLKLHVRFCYDNEEDTLFQWGPAGQTNACAADRDNHSLLSSHSLLDCASEEPTAAPATATCVGREATLSLQLSPDFSGSLLWEALETAWTSVVTAVKVGAKDAQSRSLPLMESQKVSDVCQGAAEVCP